MGVDYYDQLQLTRSAKPDEIKRACVPLPGLVVLLCVCQVPGPTDAARPSLRYRRLALKYHPDGDKSPEAAVLFTRVAEAYDVLIHREWGGVGSSSARTRAGGRGGSPGSPYCPPSCGPGPSHSG